MYPISAAVLSEHMEQMKSVDVEGKILANLCDMTEEGVSREDAVPSILRLTLPCFHSSAREKIADTLAGQVCSGLPSKPLLWGVFGS